MNLQDRIKIWKRTFARYGLFFSAWLINSLPYSATQWITRFLLSVGFCFTKRLQRVARESLHIAFGHEKSEKEIRQIIKACFQTLGTGMVEMLYYIEHPDTIREKVSIEGKEHLDNALAQGQGVVAVTAHFGNFPLMMIRLVQEGYPSHVVMRTTRDKKIDKFLFERRSRLGLQTIYSLPRKDCVQNSLRALRNNELVFMLLDQNFGSDGGVFVDFFGQKAATATGPIIFAERAKAPILLIFIMKDGKDHHKIVIEPPYEVEKGATDEETIYHNISKITKIIESYIRRFPHEWGWMHRRWKTQRTRTGARKANLNRDVSH